MKRFVTISVVCLALLLGVSTVFNHKDETSTITTSSEQDKHLLVSLHPIAMIVSALVDGIEHAQIDVILPSGASPHTYALKPSDIRMIQRADLAIWIGAELESFLNKPLQQHKHVLSLGALEGMPLRRYTSEHKHHHDDKHADEHKTTQEHEKEEQCCHDAHGVDLHLWFGVPQVRVIAQNIFERLQDVFPNAQNKLQENYNIFNVLLTKTDTQCAKRLSKLREIGYFVFHDAYGYWQDHYTLPSVGYFTVSPERQIGAKHLDEIRHKLQEKDAECVFAEPQFQSAILHTIAEQTGARIGILDPLGQNIPLSATSYFEFMEDLTTRFEHCLRPEIES